LTEYRKFTGRSGVIRFRRARARRRLPDALGVEAAGCGLGEPWPSHVVDRVGGRVTEAIGCQAPGTVSAMERAAFVVDFGVVGERRAACWALSKLVVSATARARGLCSTNARCPRRALGANAGHADGQAAAVSFHHAALSATARCSTAVDSEECKLSGGLHVG
jgi:hypothetical protein